MTDARWQRARRWFLAAFLGFEALALVGLGASLLLVGAFAAPLLAAFDDGGRATIELAVLGVGCLAAACLAVVTIVAVAADRGLPGTRQARAWRAVIAAAIAMQIGWIVAMSGTSVDPGTANRVSWGVGLVLSVVAAVCLWFEFRARAFGSAPTVPPPPRSAAISG